MYRVSCKLKSEVLLFDLLFRASTSGQAVKLAKDYARKKGHKPSVCTFKAVEQK